MCRDDLIHPHGKRIPLVWLINIHHLVQVDIFDGDIKVPLLGSFDYAVECYSYSHHVTHEILRPYSF